MPSVRDLVNQTFITPIKDTLGFATSLKDTGFVKEISSSAARQSAGTLENVIFGLGTGAGAMLGTIVASPAAGAVLAGLTIRHLQNRRRGIGNDRTLPQKAIATATSAGTLAAGASIGMTLGGPLGAAIGAAGVSFGSRIISRRINTVTNFFQSTLVSRNTLTPIETSFFGITRLSIPFAPLNFSLGCAGLIFLMCFFIIIIPIASFVIPRPGTGAGIIPGTLGCPSGWPVAGGQSYQVRQGPSTEDCGQDCGSHGPPYVYAEAIDIYPNPMGVTGPNHLAIATSPGVVLGWNNKGLLIKSSCGDFVTSYGHLGDRFVDDNSIVTAGTILGPIDTLGQAKSPHLHYEFLTGSGSYKSCAKNGDPPPCMTTPYIPQTVTVGCFHEACGVNIY